MSTLPEQPQDRELSFYMFCWLFKELAESTRKLSSAEASLEVQLKVMHSLLLFLSGYIETYATDEWSVRR